MSSEDALRVLDGRVRIKLLQLKGSPAIAEKLQQSLLKVKGITYVEVNLVTGGVLVFFESAVVTDEKVLVGINHFSSIDGPPQSGPVAPEPANPQGSPYASANVAISSSNNL